MKKILKVTFMLLVIGLFSYEAMAQTYRTSSRDTFDRSVPYSPRFEAPIPHPVQNSLAKLKLDTFLLRNEKKKPNIVWIIIDDMGYGDLGCYGGGKALGAETNFIDSIASEGLRLTSCYSQQTCTPTRSAILTGRLPMRTGLTRPILAGDKLVGPNTWESEACLAKVLSDSGYYTMLTGKWHIGEVAGMQPSDTAVGFNEFYGYFPAQKEISQDYDPRRYPDLVAENDIELFNAFQPIKPTNYLTHGYNGVPGQSDGTTELAAITSTEDMGRADAVLVDHTVKRIRSLSRNNPDQPFFIEHCFMKVHADNFDNPDYGALSDAKYPYRNAVVEVDNHVRTIIETLKEENQLENTFIFITSDNGPQMDSWPDSGYTPFRGAKGTTWEGGVRIPGIAYWPGMIKPGRVSDGVFDLMDLYGTSLTLAGIDTSALVDTNYYDYVDQSSFLFTDEGLSNRESIYFWWGTHLMGIRMRQYKLHNQIIEAEAPNMFIDYATIKNVGINPWLFNLYIDPKESMPVGHRLNAWGPTIGRKLKAHGATFTTYPPKDIGLSQ